jgi:hypothetical protein
MRTGALAILCLLVGALLALADDHEKTLVEILGCDRRKPPANTRLIPAELLEKNPFPEKITDVERRIAEAKQRPPARRSARKEAERAVDGLRSRYDAEKKRLDKEHREGRDRLERLRQDMFARARKLAEKVGRKIPEGNEKEALRKFLGSRKPPKGVSESRWAKLQDLFLVRSRRLALERRDLERRIQAERRRDLDPLEKELERATKQLERTKKMEASLSGKQKEDFELENGRRARAVELAALKAKKKDLEDQSQEFQGKATQRDADTKAGLLHQTGMGCVGWDRSDLRRLYALDRQGKPPTEEEAQLAPQPDWSDVTGTKEPKIKGIRYWFDGPSGLTPAPRALYGVPMRVEVLFDKAKRDPSVRIQVRAKDKPLTLQAARTEDPTRFVTERFLIWPDDGGIGPPPSPPTGLRVTEGDDK